MNTNLAENVKELEDIVAALAQKLCEDLKNYLQLSEAVSKMQQYVSGRKTALEKYTNDVKEYGGPEPRLGPEDHGPHQASREQSARDA